MLNLMQIYKVSLVALRRNPMRTLLTMLGVIIGVGCVVAMVAIGQGASSAIQSQIGALGTNMLIIFSGSRSSGGVRHGMGSVQTLTVDDAAAIARECPSVALAEPGVRTGAQVVFGNQNWSTSIQGTGPDFLTIRAWAVTKGSYFTEEDVKAATKVAVLGQTVAENLFGEENPVGQVVRIKGLPFRVIGLLERKGATSMGDQDDVVWFTIVASNQLGRLDPKTEQMTVIRLPSNGFFRWISDMLFPTLLRISSWFPDKVLLLDFSHHRFLGYSVLAFPYGIDVNPKDGSIWYAKLYANRIGRIDPKTLEVTEYETPMSGPRRPRFDADGIFWIPAFDESGLMRFDPATGKFETFKIPGVAQGEYETPYALNVYRPTGDVWLAANNSDRVIRFTPATKTFLSYPSPTRVTVLRDFAFTKDGRVCSSQSNLPAYAIEGGVPSYLCIDPTGGERDRAALAATAVPAAAN